jgi:hypothetical protein
LAGQGAGAVELEENVGCGKADALVAVTEAVVADQRVHQARRGGWWRIPMFLRLRAVKSAEGNVYLKDDGRMSAP